MDVICVLHELYDATELPAKYLSRFQYISAACEHNNKYHDTTADKSEFNKFN
jgi:hypothetical protein